MGLVVVKVAVIWIERQINIDVSGHLYYLHELVLVQFNVAFVLPKLST